MMNINFDALTNAATSLGMKVYTQTQMWEKTGLITPISVGEHCALDMSKDSVQLKVTTPTGSIYVKIKDKDSVKAASLNHLNWEIHNCKAIEGFQGFSLKSGGIMSKDEYDAKTAAGETVLINVDAPNRGVINIAKDTVELQAFAV